VGNKIEAIRAYLEEEIGDVFYDVYGLIKEEKDEDYDQAKKMLGREKCKFIPLVVQLIVCEDNYY
jgi:NIMA (never in mitosis gene a)-related kinase